MALHLRGTIAAWEAFASKNKYLYVLVSLASLFPRLGIVQGFPSIYKSVLSFRILTVQAVREWEAYYSDDGQRRQRAFWDKFLKGQDTEVSQWPTVEIAVRETFDKWQLRSETLWPPKNAQLTPFILSENNKLILQALLGNNLTSPSYLTYIGHQHGSKVSFDYIFDTRTEITGNSSVKLHTGY